MEPEKELPDSAVTEEEPAAAAAAKKRGRKPAVEDFGPKPGDTFEDGGLTYRIMEILPDGNYISTRV